MTPILALEMSRDGSQNHGRAHAGDCPAFPEPWEGKNRNPEVSGSKTGGNEMNYVLLEGIVADDPGLL